MLSAYAKFWKGYVDFTGRSTRSEYWLAVLANVLVCLILAFLFVLVVNLIGGATTDEGRFYLPFVILVPFFLYLLATIIPSIAIRIRRLRDGGYHWALYFLSFVPGGSLALLILYCMPSKPAPVPLDFYQSHQNQ